MNDTYRLVCLLCLVTVGLCSCGPSYVDANPSQGEKASFVMMFRKLPDERDPYTPEKGGERGDCPEWHFLKGTS